MKNLLFAMLLLVSAGIYAQKDQTIFSNVQRSGGWGAPIFEYTNLGKDLETTAGGGGALVLNDFYLGGYGMGTADLYNYVNATNLREKLSFKHGGFWIGFTPLQSRVIHPYFSTRIGWGKARYRASEISNPDRVISDLKDNVFVMTPELGLELNVFSFFRIAVTGSYRWVNGVEGLPTFENEDLSSYGATLTLRFGGFGRD
jgi:hypothetical protein